MTENDEKDDICPRCKLNKTQARTGVLLHKYTGWCNHCGAPIEIEAVVGKYVRDIEDGTPLFKGICQHEINLFHPYHCTNCGVHNKSIALICGDLDVTAEFTELANKRKT